MSDTEHQLRRQAEAARDLIAALRGDGYGDDAELIEDAIDGQTDIKEAIAAAIDEIDEAEVLILGGKAKIEQIAGRVAMEEKRVERIRASIERAIVTAELSEAVRLPTATVSLSRRAAGLVVTDEALIPSPYFSLPEPPAPKLDRKKLLAALRERTDAIEAASAIQDPEERVKAMATALKLHPLIPGAGLDNGGFNLTVRRK